MKKNDLQPLEDVVDGAFLDLKKRGYTLKQKKLNIIAICRQYDRNILSSSFFEYLKKVKEIDPTFSFFKDLLTFLENTYKQDPYKKMEEELKIRGIDAKDRNQVDLEGLDYLIAQLPQDEVFLSILTFYLIDPKSVQSFFNKDPLFLLKRPEKEMLKIIRDLSPAQQWKMVERIRVYAERT